MQSGNAASKNWVLELEAQTPLRIEPLMGWTSSDDTGRQVHLSFETREEAVAYAVAHGIPHQVMEPKESRRVRKSYSDNFAFSRKEPWTH
jgi:hypothetical protein